MLSHRFICLAQFGWQNVQDLVDFGNTLRKRFTLLNLLAGWMDLLAGC